MVSFEPQKLDADKGEDFFADAKTGPQAIVGGGQMVYWKCCTIRVFPTGKEDDPPIAGFDYCDGQALVLRGLSVLFLGTKIKEV